MKQHFLRAGARLSIDGTPHKLVKETPNAEWQIENELTLRPSLLTETQLYRLYDEYRLEFSHDDLTLPNGKRARPSQPIQTLSPRDQLRIAFKIEFVHEMELRKYPGWHTPLMLDGNKTTQFEQDLKEVSCKLNRPRPVSRGSYYEWRGTLLVYGDASELRSRYKGHLQIDPRARATILRIMQKYIDDAHEGASAEEKNPKFNEIVRAIKDDIDRQNAEINQRRELARARGVPFAESTINKPSSVSTYYEYWNKFDAIDRDLVLKGRGATAEAYRGGRGFKRPAIFLDHVEYDETHLPLFAYDELLGIALGRPWLSWYFDAAVELPIGIYLGFEEVSDISLMSALRSCCLPKTFLQPEYGIDPDYPFGIPAKMVFDNPFSQHGKTIEYAAGDLHNSFQFAPSGVSWFKPLVESSFNVLNSQFLSQLPGVIMTGVKRKDYDPTKHGCIGFRSLIQLVWKWIVDVLARAPHSTRRIPRIDVWRESVDRKKPGMIGRKRDLDLLFWIIRQGDLIRVADHRGVSYEGLRYYCPELQQFRNVFGNRRRVLVKVNPSNLEFIFVQAGPNLPWFRAFAVEREYAHNRSLLQHQLCRQQALKLYGRDDVEAYERGQAELSAMIRETVELHSSLRVMSLACKAWGLGTQHITDALDHDGNLGPLGGPFAGHQLAPPMSVLNAFEGRPAVRSSAPPTWPDPPVSIPDFSADLSLGSR